MPSSITVPARGEGTPAEIVTLAQQAKTDLDALVSGGASTLRGDLASTDVGKGASLVGVHATSNDLETALAAVKAKADAAAVAATLASTSSGQGASLVGVHAGATNVEAALAAVKTTADAALPASSAIQKATVTISVAGDNFAALAMGVKTFDKNIGAALPANARVLAATAEAVTAFDDNGGGGTALATIGTTAGGTQVGNVLNVALGQTGFPKAFQAGAQGYLFAPAAGAQLSARVTSNHDLNTFTAGAITISVFYIPLN